MTAVVHLTRAAAWLVVAVAVLVVLTQPGSPLSPPAHAAEALLVRGALADLEPGRVGTLTLTVVNPASQPVVVRRLSARVVGGGPAACGPEGLTVTPWSGELVVPAQGSASTDLHLVVAVDDACAGQTWHLSYTAGT